LTEADVKRWNMDHKIFIDKKNIGEVYLKNTEKEEKKEEQEVSQEAKINVEVVK